MESNFSQGDLLVLADLYFEGRALVLLHVKMLGDVVGDVLCDDKGYFEGDLLVLPKGNFEGDALQHFNGNMLGDVNGYLLGDDETDFEGDLLVFPSPPSPLLPSPLPLPSPPFPWSSLTVTHWERSLGTCQGSQMGTSKAT